MLWTMVQHHHVVVSKSSSPSQLTANVEEGFTNKGTRRSNDYVLR